VLRKNSPPYKLNFGCGRVRHAGWVNIDVSWSAAADVRWDVTNPFPLDAGTCSHIYHESLLEIFPPDEVRALLRDWHRLLAPGGVMRMAMPSLEEVVSLYMSGEWRQFDWRKPGYAHYQTIQNGAAMINGAFRHPDNRWLYDWEDLRRVVIESGFSEITRGSWGESSRPEFRNLETRPESNLICEVRK
jgi:predicted SAM-dependent methyltransferase